MYAHAQANKIAIRRYNSWWLLVKNIVQWCSIQFKQSETAENNLMALQLVCHRGYVLHSQTDTSETLIMPKYVSWSYFQNG